MSRISVSLAKALNFLRHSLDQNLHWQLSRQKDVAQLRQTQALAEQTLVAQLRKQAQQLNHELAMAETENHTKLAMVKIRCKQDLKDYQQYLQSLDKLKESLRSSYANLPEAVAFTIHHHAKQLLNRMWEAEEHREKIKIEMQLLEFMAAVHEDSQKCLQGRGESCLPEKALAFIDAGQNR